MEGEKKRKRTVNGSGDRRREVAAGGSNAVFTPPPPPPSEAEVEEFFAILRRMHVAVKYLEKSDPILPANVNRHGSRLTAMETDTDGVGRIPLRNGGLELDLNMEPEPETNGV
ncbi:protein NIM1-INTERACTING 2-like [Nicotiana tabacum]|uniref:Protein NIM1-INTERACTING 2-like n=1 Tax=Nicotiana tabacum TaxID=4097 RepID=A0AC58SQT5_TOBAC|nr:protein NIM1-INTERACTING 2 [Nicotiana tomentosiformis]